MKNMFGQEIKFLLENGLNPKLSILVEEDQNPEDLGGSTDIFDISDDDNQKEKEPESTESGDGALLGGDDESLPEDPSDPSTTDESLPEDPSDPSGTDADSDADVDEIRAKGFEDLETSLEKVATAIEKASSDAGIGPVQDNISSFINASVNETKSYNYSKGSIKMFLSEDVDPENLEKDIDALDRVLSKGTDLVDKFTKGQEVDIEKYVDAAINAYRNFDNLFAKEKIVKQAAINVLVLNSGAKADQNIKEFENLFHEELYKQFGIDYEEFALNSDHKYETGVGAVKQG